MKKREARRSLNPGVVEPSDGREGIRSTSLQHDRKSRKRLLKVARPKQAFVPGERGIEIIHQVLREDVRVSRGKRIERLRRDGVKQRIDGVGIGSLHARIRLKTKPGRVFLIDVVVDACGLDLLMVVAGMRNALPVGATVSIWRIARRGAAVRIERTPQNLRGRAAGISIKREHLLIERNQLRRRWKTIAPAPLGMQSEVWPRGSCCKTYC